MNSNSNTSLRVSVALAFGGLLAGCCHTEPFGALSNSPVVAVGRSSGAVLDSPKPVEGGLVTASLAPGVGCIPGAQLLTKLGPVCDHETENPPPPTPPAPVDDLKPGKPKRTPEVRWYCGGRLAVRVVFEPCDSNADGSPDGIAPVEIGVATHPKQE